MAGYDPSSFFTKKSNNEAEVVVTYDPSVINRRQKMSSSELEQARKENDEIAYSIAGSQSLFDKQSSGKSDRKFKLDNAIRTKKVTNIYEVEKLIGVELPTIRKYLRELGYKVDNYKNIVK